MGRHLSCTVYVGNLPLDVKDWEIEDLFCKYGRIVDIEMKLPPRPRVFALWSLMILGALKKQLGAGMAITLMVLFCGARSPVDRRGGDGGGRYGVSRRTEYRVTVRRLPPSASWQDLKDHIRKAGDVCFVQVFRDGDGMMGVVDYTNYEDMQYAIRKLDDTEFQNPFSESYIRVKAHEGSLPRKRSRSRSPIQHRSRSLEKRPRLKSRSRSASLIRPSR